MIKFENMSERQCFDYVSRNEAVLPYVVISIQPPTMYSYRYVPNARLVDVLTQGYDDLDLESEIAVKACLAEGHALPQLMTTVQARDVAKFAEKWVGTVSHFVIHCAAGVSRSAAVAAALCKIYNGHDNEYFNAFIPNRYVYSTILSQYYALFPERVGKIWQEGIWCDIIR